MAKGIDYYRQHYHELFVCYKNTSFIHFFVFHFSTCQSFSIFFFKKEFSRAAISSTRCLHICVRKPQFTTHDRQGLVSTIKVFQLAKTCSEVISCDIFRPHACGVMFVCNRMYSGQKHVWSYGERLK